MHVHVHPLLIFSMYSLSDFSKPSFWPSILSFNVSALPVFFGSLILDWRGLGMLFLTFSPLFFMSPKKRNMFVGVLDVVFYRVEKIISHEKWWGVRLQRSRKVHFCNTFFHFPSRFDSLSGERLINCSILSYIELRAANDLRHEWWRGGGELLKRWISSLKLKNNFFLLFLDVKSAGGFDETVYFACTEGIFQVKYKFNSVDGVFGLMLITNKVHFHLSLFFLKKKKKLGYT